MKVKTLLADVSAFLMMMFFCAAMVVAAAGLTAPPAEAGTKVTAMFTHERSNGLTKICYYSALGNEYAITIRAVELCPLTIEVEL